MNGKKRRYLIVAIGVLAVAVFVLNNQRLAAWAQAWVAQSFRKPDPEMFATVYKDQYRVGEMEKTTTVANPPQKANVLFLIDTSNAMTFTPKGKMPHYETILNQVKSDYPGWTLTAQQNEADKRANVLVGQCTFGVGARPAFIASNYSNSGTVNVQHYGRDVDSSNNEVGNLDNYYSATPGKPYMLTFVDATRANSATLTAGWQSAELVPNDSRLYQLKLIFNRMLDDSDTLSKLRFALSTTYLAQSDGSGGHLFYRVSPWGASGNYTNGAIGYDFTRGNSGNTVGTQWAISAGAASGYDKINDETWLTVKRAFLRIPFGEYTSEHVAKFRTLIDGIEDNHIASDGAPFALVNPEITTSGEANLGMAIFPAHSSTAPGNASLRNTYLSKGYIYYNSTSAKVDKTQLGGGKHIFAKSSGEAAGSVIDFFSPDGRAENAYKTLVDNYPIRNRCEANWLVILTAGDNVGNPYKSHKAVEHLYKYTKDNDVVRIKDPSKAPTATNLEKVRLFTPIRTMVIGFVDDGLYNSDGNVTALVDELNLMADYGDDGIKNESAKAYFANDVTKLMGVLREVLAKIVADALPKVADAPTTIEPASEGAGQAEGFLNSYLPVPDDQWKGYFSHYVLVAEDPSSPDSRMVVSEDWKLHDLFRIAAGNPSAKNLYVWNQTKDGSLYKVAYPTDSPTVADPVFAKLLGLDNPKSFSNYVPGISPHPANLMTRWLFGHDYDRNPAAGKSKSFVRETVLTDMGKSGYKRVKKTAIDDAHAQPGYREWLASTDVMEGGKDILFFHTNDGILHAVDAKSPDRVGWGGELWAFIPPNALAGQRLAKLKFDISTPFSNVVDSFTEDSVSGMGVDFFYTVSLDWKDSKWDTENNQQGYSSNPAYVTDGKVNLYDLPHGTDTDKRSGKYWKRVLIGSMGRGGMGLYAMDVTNSGAPKFLWALENEIHRYETTLNIIGLSSLSKKPTSKDIGPSAIVFGRPNANSPQYTAEKLGKIFKWDASTLTGSNAFQAVTVTPTPSPVTAMDPILDYDLLGINAPEALVGTTLLNTTSGLTPTNIGILPAGDRFSSDEGPVFGAALYLFDPLSGDLKKTFSNESAHKTELKDAFNGTYNTRKAGLWPSTTEWTDVLGPLITSPSPIWQNTAEKYLTGAVLPTLMGDIYELSFLDASNAFHKKVEDWKMRRIAYLEPGPSRAKTPNPFPLTVDSSTGNDVRIYGGTGIYFRRSGLNVEYLFSRLAGTELGANAYNLVRSSNNCLFGFKKTDRPIFLDRKNSGADTTLLRAAVSEDKKGDGALGWVIPLPGKEALSAATIMFAGDFFAATFTPVSGGSQLPSDSCVTTNGLMEGFTRLYKMDGPSGEGRWEESAAKYLEFKGIKIGGLTVGKIGASMRLFISFTDLDNRFSKYAGQKNVNVAFADSPDYAKMDAMFHTDGLLSIGKVAKAVETGYPEGAVKLNYWREIFID